MLAQRDVQSAQTTVWEQARDPLRDQLCDGLGGCKGADKIGMIIEVAIV